MNANQALKEDPSLKYLVPVGRSGYAIAAGYLGLFSLIIPFLCFATVTFSILGTLDLRKHPEKLGWGRIVTGYVLGGIMTLVHLIVLAGAMFSHK
jgi:hypothetical protein